MKGKAHNKPIMKISYHPGEPDLLVSGSRDRTVKVWNTSQQLENPLKSFTNIDPVDRLRWIPSEEHPHWLGVGTVLNESSIVVWDVVESSIPKLSFKMESKHRLSDVVFLAEHVVYSTKENTLVSEHFSKANEIGSERRGNPLCCSIKDSYAFGFDESLSKMGSATRFFSVKDAIKLEAQRANKELNLISIHHLSSLYEQEPFFPNLEEEMKYFVDKYVSPDIGSLKLALQANQKLCSKVGKAELSEIWQTLTDIMVDNTEELPEKELLTERPRKNSIPNPDKRIVTNLDDPETQLRVFEFYLHNPDLLITDLNNSRVMVSAGRLTDKGSKDSRFLVLKSYEDELLRRVSEDPYCSPSIVPSVMSSPSPQRKILPGVPAQTPSDSQSLSPQERANLASATITSLIDNGEFIHGYQMYLCLETHLRAHLPSQTTKVWTSTYIDLLISMGFYRKAAHVAKHSSNALSESMRERESPFFARCAHCKGELETMKEGVCGKCAKDRKCSICLKTVKGLSLWCQVCGHGGHFHDVKKWFGKKDAKCATGCGHVCFRFDEAK